MRVLRVHVMCVLYKLCLFPLNVVQVAKFTYQNSLSTMLLAHRMAFLVPIIHLNKALLFHQVVCISPSLCSVLVMNGRVVNPNPHSVNKVLFVLETFQFNGFVSVHF